MIRAQSFAGQVAEANAAAAAAAVSAAEAEASATAADVDRAATADLVASLGANASTADTALLETARIGRLSTPVTGTSLAHATYHFGEPAPWDFTVIGIGGFGLNGGGTIKLKKSDRSGITMTQDGADVDAIIPAGEFVLTEADVGDFTAFSGTAGQYLGFFAGGTNGTDQKLGLTAVTADTDGFYRSGSTDGNVTSYDDATAIGASPFRLEFYFVIARIKPTAEVTIANELTLADTTQTTNQLRDAFLIPSQYYMGRNAAPVVGDGGVATLLTRINWQHFICNGWISAVEIYAEGAGSYYLRVGSLPSGGGAFVPRDSRVLSVPGSGLQTITLSPPMRVQAGEYWSYYCDQLRYTTPTVGTPFGSANGGGFWSELGNLATWTTGGSTGAQRMETRLIVEYDQQNMSGSQVVMPGELLAQADRVTPTDVTVLWSATESTSKGTNGEGFLYTAVNDVEMFAQGIRAARSGSLAGLSNSGGTATKVPAEELETNLANSWAYDNEDLNDRANTGLCQMADHVIKLAKIRSNVDPDLNTIFLANDAHGGYRVDLYNYNARWWQLGDEIARDCVTLYEAEDRAPKCLIVMGHFANNATQGIFLSDDSTLVNLTAATKDDFKAIFKEQIRLKTQMLQTIFGQPDQIHWLILTCAVNTTGNGSISGVARDGIFSQVVVELSQELSNWHVLGHDQEAEKTTADNTHRNAFGYTRMCLTRARAVQEIVRENKCPTDAVRWLGSTWSGTTVTQYFRSVNQLTTDTTNIAAMTNLGVAVKVNGSIVSLSTAPVVDNAPSDGWHEHVRTITATLSTAPTSGDDVQFRLGQDYGRSTGAGGYTAEGAHNFRTTATETHADVGGSPMTIRWWIPASSTTAIEL